MKVSVLHRPDCVTLTQPGIKVYPLGTVTVESQVPTEYTNLWNMGKTAIRSLDSRIIKMAVFIIISLLSESNLFC